MEVRLDKRFIALGAALAAGSKDTGRPEHELASLTRRQLSRFSEHDAVRWFWDQVGKFELLPLAMQVGQLDGPPDFGPHPAGEIPPFVEEYFSMVPRQRASECLAEWWRVAGIEDLLHAQQPHWQEVLDDVVSALGAVRLEEFQARFFGRFPYHAVVVPIANMPYAGAQAVGVATNTETCAVCLPYGNSRFSEHATGLLIVAQHEASHVMVDLIQRLHPTVTEQCLFIEETHAASGRFASGYGDPDMRFVETLIRASTCFFLQSLGMEAEAESFFVSQLKDGVSAIGVFVEALWPWWQKRAQGKAEGLDVYFAQLPAQLRTAAQA